MLEIYLLFDIQTSFIIEIFFIDFWATIGHPVLSISSNLHHGLVQLGLPPSFILNERSVLFLDLDVGALFSSV